MPRKSRLRCLCPETGARLPPGHLRGERAIGRLLARFPASNITKAEAEANARALAAGPPVRGVCWLLRSYRIRARAAEHDKLYEPRPAGSTPRS